MTAAPHIPVLLRPLLQACAPVRGTWVDGTFGAGGYAKGLVRAGADKVIGIDRDPEAQRLAASWLLGFEGRIVLREGTFSELDRIAARRGREA
jgi:16S rRNA (cytosine1402-N4)-methyltransferase